MSRDGVARSVLTRLARFAALGLVAWGAFYAVHLGLPGLRTGADQVVARKLELLDGGDLFPAQARTRLAVFGNSRVLAGFVPDRFDEAFGDDVASYNLGLPGTESFVPELARLVHSGSPPTHVVLTGPWNDGGQPTVFDRFRDDDRIATQLFPFRRLVRDGTLFVLRSGRHGGPAAYYRHGVEILEEVRRDRGYHFIESQSHYPDHRLPDGFRLESDDATLAWARTFPRAGYELSELTRLRAAAGFRIAVVPLYMRPGERRCAAANAGEAQALAGIDVELLGPECWTFQTRLFSDPVHLNREGARIYTAKLAELTKGWLEPDSGQR